MPRKPRTPTRADVAAAEKAVGALVELLWMEESAARHAEARKRIGALLASIPRLIPSAEVRELAGLIHSDAKLLFRLHGSGDGHTRGDLRTQYLRDCARLRAHIGTWAMAAGQKG